MPRHVFVTGGRDERVPEKLYAQSTTLGNRIDALGLHVPASPWRAAQESGVEARTRWRRAPRGSSSLAVPPLGCAVFVEAGRDAFARGSPADD
jgi:hypothetical protein